LQDEFQELKKRYWGQHLWGRGYFCTTVGPVTEEMIKKGAMLLAGGTDFIPLLKLGLKAPRYLVLLSRAADRVSDLKSVRFNGNVVVLGACVTLTDIAEHAKLAQDVPALREAALTVASPQIRNRGTLGGNLFQDRRCLYFNQSNFWRSSIKPCFKTGGNICHQIPNSNVCRAFYYSDTATALLALGGEATIRTPGGEEKKLPLEEVIDRHLISNGTEEHENILLTEVCFPVPLFSCFIKFAERSSFDFPLFNFAAVKSVSGWCVFVGGWGARIKRLPNTEEALAEGVASDKAEQIFLEELKDQREFIRESGLSPKMREFLPLRSCIEKIRSA
jgi:CO/xanthine dehydrogenase FAD-binding subunit